MEDDSRSFRVALIADEYVNPEPGGLDGLAVAESEGWGAIKLPANWYPDRVAEPLLVQVAEQVEEFVRHGYDIVVVGGRAGLERALSTLGVEVPDSVIPVTADELRAFLDRRPDVEPA